MNTLSTLKVLNDLHLAQVDNVTIKRELENAIIRIIDQNLNDLPKVDLNELVLSHSNKSMQEGLSEYSGALDYVVAFASKHEIPLLLAQGIVLATCKPLKNVFGEIGNEIVMLISCSE